MPNCLVGKRLNYFVVLSAASMVPHRKSDLSKVVVSALFTGACVSFISACVAGKCLSLVSKYCFNSPSHICIEKAPNLQCSQFIPKELRALRNMCKSFPLASLSPLPRNPLCPQGSWNWLCLLPKHKFHQSNLWDLCVLQRALSEVSEHWDPCPLLLYAFLHSGVFWEWGEVRSWG